MSISNPAKEETLNWINGLLVDARADKPYKMNKKDTQIYHRMLDILEDYSVKSKK